jgi:hypothetical protein
MDFNRLRRSAPPRPASLTPLILAFALTAPDPDHYIATTTRE